LDEIDRACFHRFNSKGHIAVAGDDDDRQVDLELFE